MKTLWSTTLFITGLTLYLHVIGTLGHLRQDLPSSWPLTSTRTHSDKSAPSSSWFDNTGLYQNVPKLFQLPYEKITSPLSSFISWITRNDRNVRTHDSKYISGKSTGQRSPGVMGSPSLTLNKEKETASLSSSFSSPITSSSNLNPLAVQSPRSSLSSSLSSLSSIKFPSLKSRPVNQRRQDLLSSFSFTRPSFTPTVSETISSSSSSSQRSNIFGSKDLSTSPQFSITFPRSTPAKQRQLSQLTMGLIAKYNPKPKVYFIPKYYTSPYPVSVPFLTHEKVVMTPEQRIRDRGVNRGNNGDDYGGNNDELENGYDGKGDNDYDSSDENRNDESIEKNSMLPYGSHRYQDKPHHPYSDDHSHRSVYLRHRHRKNQRKSTNKHYPHYFYNHQAGQDSGYSANQITSSDSGPSPISPVSPRANENVNQLTTSKRQRKPSKISTSSSPWRAIDGNNGAHRPYTGKAQYSTIDNSSDPMSPSASKMISFWANRQPRRYQ